MGYIKHRYFLFGLGIVYFHGKIKPECTLIYEADVKSRQHSGRISINTKSQDEMSQHTRCVY